jgi:hypothetical protein
MQNVIFNRTVLPYTGLPQPLVNRWDDSVGKVLVYCLDYPASTPAEATNLKLI